HCWWECRLVQALWKSAWRYLKELGLEVSYGILSLFWIHRNFRIVFSSSMGNAIGLFIGIALHL
ncbi:Retrovirus-related Pol polyprotein LINE-1, partial [Heterocephalus glaber]